MKKRKMKQKGADPTKSFPPVEVGCQCIGHSFAPGNQPFIPMIEVLPGTKVCFSPRTVGQSAFASIQIVNKTDTPTFFKFDKDINEVFRIVPEMGMLDGNQFKCCV